MLKLEWRAPESVEQLEARIEDLEEAIQRSRRLMLAGRACAIVGPVLLAGLLVGLVTFTPVRMIAALALAIGGLVLTGSSRSSTEQLELALRQATNARTAAIDALDLVEFGEQD
jgi:hypothetical protein